MHVELEPEWPVCSTPDFIEWRGCRGADDPRCARGPGALRGSYFAVRVNRAMKCSWCEENRTLQATSEQCQRCIHLRDVAKNPRPQENFVERFAIPSQRLFIAGARRKVLVRRMCDARASKLLKLVKTEDALWVDRVGCFSWLRHAGLLSEALDDCINVQCGGVEQRNSSNRRRGQQEWKFRSAKDDAVDSSLISKSRDQ